MGTAMSALPLVFNAPRRGLPPTHFADLDAEARRAAVTDLGLPAFRADQLARQYYGRFESDPAAMTDLPATARADLAPALFPPRRTQIPAAEWRTAAPPKTLCGRHDGALVESV